MAERRSLVGRAVRWTARAVWTLVSTSGDLDTGPVRADEGARRPRRRSRSARDALDDPRHHRPF